MSKYKYMIVKRIDENNGEVNLIRIRKSIPISSGDVAKPHKPGKSLEERITNVIAQTVPQMIAGLLKPIVIEMRNGFQQQAEAIKRIEMRLDEQDKFNKIVREYMSSHP